MTVSNKIQEKRISLKLTRPQLGEKVGVSWETIKAYETKGSLPSLTVAMKLSIALDTSMDELFSLEEQAQIEQIEE